MKRMRTTYNIIFFALKHGFFNLIFLMTFYFILRLNSYSWNWIELKMIIIIYSLVRDSSATFCTSEACAFEWLIQYLIHLCWFLSHKQSSLKLLNITLCLTSKGYSLCYANLCSLNECIMTCLKKGACCTSIRKTWYSLDKHNK